MLSRTTGLRLSLKGAIDEYDTTILLYDVYATDDNFYYHHHYEIKVNEDAGAYCYLRAEKRIDDCIRRYYTIQARDDVERLYELLSEHNKSGLIPPGASIDHTYCKYRDPNTGEETTLIFIAQDGRPPKVLPTLEEFRALRCPKLTAEGLDGDDNTLEDCCIDYNYADCILSDSSLTEYPEYLSSWVQYKDDID